MYQKQYPQHSIPGSPHSVTSRDSETIPHEFAGGRVVGNQQYANELYGSLRKGGAVHFISWHCAGLVAATFSSVFSYTALQGVTRPLMATQLDLTRPEQVAVQRFVELPMALSFLIGLLSDCYPIFGLRRKAYMLIGMALNAFGTIVIGAIASYFESLDKNEKRSGALVFLVILMTAVSSFGCMFTYLCVHTRTVELSQQEPLGIRGSIQASYLIVRRITSLFTGVFTYLVLGNDSDTPNVSFSNALFLMTLICVLPLPIVLRFWKEEIYSLPVGIKVRANIFWKIMQQKAVWRILTFIAFFTMFLNVRFADSTSAVRTWAGANKDNSLVLRAISDLTIVLVLVAWRFVFMNRPWRSFFALAPFFQIVPALAISAIVAYDVSRDRYLYRSIISLTGITGGITVLNNLVPLTEIVQEGSEGVSVGLVLSLERLINVFINTNSQGLLRGDNFFSPADVKKDTADARNDVFVSLVLNYGINSLALFGLLFLPTQKLDAQQMRMYGGFTKVASTAIVLFATVLLLYSMTINIMTFVPSTACARLVGGRGCPP